MRNVTSRDRVAEQFRAAADAAQALAIQEDQEAADPVARVPVHITRQKKALMLNALDNNSRLAIRDTRDLGGGTDTAHRVGGRAGAGSRGKGGIPVPVPPLRHRGNWMTGAWPLRDYIELGALPGAVPCARLHARQLMWEWRLTGLSESVELLVSELVTNGITASQSLKQAFPVRLWLLSDKARALILVWDASPRTPARIERNEEAENGRGLLLVEAISNQWNWYRTEDIGGKVVWASVV
jgi:anti-sigma regulatory factor (Ser/Thr protein kinase)